MFSRKVDVLIVGGGAIGVSIACYAASAGAAVLLVEKGSIGSGSSYGNAGFLAAGHCIPLPRPGVLAEGFAGLTDPEGPFTIRPALDVELLRWLWRFCRSCSEKHYTHAVGILKELCNESLALHAGMAAMAGGAHGDHRENHELQPFPYWLRGSRPQRHAGWARFRSIVPTVFHSRVTRRTRSPGAERRKLA